MPHECFAEEIAIDFPSVGRVAERRRDAFLGEADGGGGVHLAEVLLSKREACDGLVVPVDVPIRATCAECGGRGETWTERCDDCGGTGESIYRHEVRVSVPAGVADGATFRFRVTSPDAAAVRVEVRVAIRSSAA